MATSSEEVRSYRYLKISIFAHMFFVLPPACLDGALHMWRTSSNFVRPNMTIENAHVKGTETGSVVFSVDRQTVLTRGGDDTVKCASLSHHPSMVD